MEVETYAISSQFGVYHLSSQQMVEEDMRHCKNTSQKFANAHINSIIFCIPNQNVHVQSFPYMFAPNKNTQMIPMIPHVGTIYKYTDIPIP